VTPAGRIVLTRSELAGSQTVQEAHRERPLIGDGAHLTLVEPTGLNSFLAASR
jgi:hypothetical protein